MSYRKLIFRNGLRNKRRTVLTVLSVALALFVLSTLFSFLAQFERNLEESNPLRLITRHKVSLANVLPERYGPQIERIPGVAAMTAFDWFGGLYIDQAHTDFAQFSCNPERLFDVYTEIRITPEEKEAFVRERGAFIAGRRKAVKHGWKLGDRITLTGQIYPINLELTLRGIYDSTPNNEAAVYFHRDYVQEALGQPGIVGTYWILADSIDSVPRIIEAIDSTFANTDAPTKTETERAFQLGFVSMLGNLQGLILMITGIIVFSILLVTANTMAMSVRERVREIAVLKALGFNRWKVLGLLVSESVMISATGGVLGWLATRLLFGSSDLSAFTQGFLQYLEVTWGVFGIALLISVLIGIASAGVPAYRASRLTVAEGLRFVG